jgi:DNA-binding CsgD family transcriptional regulator
LIWGAGDVDRGIHQLALALEVRTLSDQARFAIWFFVVSDLLGAYFAFAGTLEKSSWAVAVPAYLVVSTVFWLWRPRFLLRGNIGLRPLLPGALLSALLLGGAIATSPFFLGSWLNSDCRHFGSFGPVIALLALAMGEKARRRTVATRDDLTAQERQIAELPRDGLSNPEIGARLFLSPRTVEWNLRKVFGKLGIRSRHELPSALTSSEPELGLV